MNTVDIIFFVLVILLIFTSPFLLSNIIPTLKKHLEKPFEEDIVTEEQKKEYSRLTDNVRLTAIIFLLFGIVGMILVLLNDLGEHKRFALMGTVILIISSIFIWKRHLWSVWLAFFLMLPIFFLSGFTIASLNVLWILLFCSTTSSSIQKLKSFSP